jgi:hypothetical protein
VDCHQGATPPSARSADQPPAEVAGWNHPIRVTTVHPAGSRVSTTVTPAVKVENVADDGIQREVEGGDHRLLLQSDHRGQPPPVEPAAQDRGRHQDLPGRVVQRRRPSAQGLHPGRGRRRRARAVRGPPPRPEAASSPRPGRIQDVAAVFLSIAVVATALAAAPSRRHGRMARRQAATGQSRWPPADANPPRPDRDFGGPPRRAGTASATRVRTTDGRPPVVPCTDEPMR